MTDRDLLPLLGAAPLDAPLAWHQGRMITRDAYLSHAAALARTLPDQRHALLTCANRYNFMVAFAALLMRGQTALLPPGQAPDMLESLARRYGAYRLDDHPVDAVAEAARKATPRPAIPRVAAAHIAAILFTSGSTGEPRAQAKTWKELHGVTLRAMDRFALEESGHQIVATVPAQHSYGFESSVLYTLLGPGAVHSGHPLYPADVCEALHAMDAPRVLITTPLHLDVCLRAGLEWPELAGIVSATAPLDPDLAERAETRLGAALHEIYGCSEAGALASRRTRTDAAWTPYADVRLESAEDGLAVHAPYLDGPRPLSDRLRIEADGRFILLGRSSEQVKLAGKRTSLSELNHHLLSIEGVEEGSFVVPDGPDTRLAAVVVAPRVQPADIRRRLARLIDPVFMPRPLVRVPRLERTGTGKLQRGYLLDIISAHSAPPPREPA
jgi:acyl-coenzyme A synthetase/AMP-(fatty) acid ligase